MTCDAVASRLAPQNERSPVQWASEVLLDLLERRLKADGGIAVHGNCFVKILEEKVISLDTRVPQRQYQGARTSIFECSGEDLKFNAVAVCSHTHVDTTDSQSRAGQIEVKQIEIRCFGISDFYL